MDAEASDNPKLNKYQDSVATTDPKGPEDLDSDSSFLLELTEDNEVLGAGSRQEENTQKTSVCLPGTMGESMKAATVPGKQTEGSVQSEVLSEGSSGAVELLPKKRQFS